MTTRAVEVGAGIGWLRRALDLGRANPRAIFGGAALLLVTLCVGAVGLSLLLVLASSALNADPTASMVVSAIVGLGIVALMAAMMVGYLRLIHAVEEGRPASAADVLTGFTDLAASGRAIGFMLLLTIAQYVLIIALVSVFAHDFGAWYIDNLKTSMSGQPPVPVTSLPKGFGTAFVLMAVVGLLSYAVQAIGLGQIANGGAGIRGAFSDGVSGALKNTLPFGVFLLLLLGASIVLVLVFVLVAAIVAALAKIIGMWLFVLIGIPLYFAFVVAMMVVMFGVMYFVWRDICGDARDAGDVRNDLMEA